ncbi:MAG: hypothetical protein NXI02_01885 [Rhodobacteraceae bacterium]|nr:hypothetical protein [Paracoccaceae bacterium]
MKLIRLVLAVRWKNARGKHGSFSRASQPSGETRQPNPKDGCFASQGTTTLGRVLINGRASMTTFGGTSEDDQSTVQVSIADEPLVRCSRADALSGPAFGCVHCFVEAHNCKKVCEPVCATSGETHMIEQRPI